MRYEVGDIVIFRPRWPNKPAFGIWTSDTELVTKGKAVRVSDAYDLGGRIRYSIQFDYDGDGTFHSAHWPAEEDEILRLATPEETP